MTYTAPIRVAARDTPFACQTAPSLDAWSGRMARGSGAVAEAEARNGTDRLASIGTMLRLKTGETLYIEGEPANHCYEVIAGLVKEYNTLRDGSRHICDFRYRGELVGLPHSNVHQHTVEAVGDVCLMSYPVGRFRTVIAETPALSVWFTQILLSDLERSQAHGLALSRLSAMERVARFLLSLSRVTDPADRLKSVFAIPMSRQDMADHLGLTIETVCRCLTALKRQGLISMTTAHGFKIPNQSALSALANREETPTANGTVW